MSLQVLCLYKKNKNLFLTEVVRSGRVSVAVYTKQTKMIANSFSSKSITKFNKVLPKKITSIQPLSKATVNNNFDHHSKRNVVTKKKSITRSATNKVSTAKFRLRTTSDWQLSLKKRREAKLVTTNLKKSLKTKSSNSKINKLKNKKSKRYIRPLRYFRLAWRYLNPPVAQWWRWRRLGPKIVLKQFKKKIDRKPQSKRVALTNLYMIMSAKTQKPVIIKPYQIDPSLRRSFRRTVQKWRFLRSSLKPSLTNIFQNRVFRKKPRRLHKYNKRRRRKKRVLRARFYWVKRGALLLRKMRYPRALRVYLLRKIIKKLNKKYKSRSSKLSRKRFSKLMKRRLYDKYQGRRKKKFINKRLAAIARIRVKINKNLFKRVKKFFKRTKRLLTLQYKNFPKRKKETLKQWNHFLVLKRKLCFSKFYSKHFFKTHINFQVSPTKSVTKIKPRNNVKGFILRPRHIAQPPIYKSSNLSPLSFLNTHVRYYRSVRSAKWKKYKARKKQLSAFDFTRKRTIIYTETVKKMRERLDTKQIKKKKKDRLRLENLLKRKNRKYLRRYKRWEPITANAIVSRRFFWLRRGRYFKKRRKFLRIKYRRWLRRKLRVRRSLPKTKQKFLRRKNFRRTALRYFWLTFGKYRTARKIKPLNLARFFDSTFSLPFRTLLVASRARVRKKRRYVGRKKLSRFKAVFRQRQLVKNVGILQKQLQLLGKTDNLHKISKYTNEMLHLKYPLEDLDNIRLKLHNKGVKKNIVSTFIKSLPPKKRRAFWSRRALPRAYNYLRFMPTRTWKATRSLLALLKFKNTTFFKVKKIKYLKRTSDRIDPANFIRYKRDREVSQLIEKFRNTSPYKQKTILHTTLSNNYRKSKHYRRAYLRMRMRTTLTRRQRVRLTSKGFFLKGPRAYNRRSKPTFLSKRSFWLKKRFGNKSIQRSKYLRNVLTSNTTKVDSVLLNNTSRTYFKSLRASEKQRAVKALPYFTPSYKLLLRRWHAYRDRDGNPLQRAWISKSAKRRLAIINKARTRRGQKKFKKKQDPVFRELEATFGTISSLGYRRKRRVLALKRNKHRHVSTQVVRLNFSTPNVKFEQFKIKRIKNSKITKSSTKKNNKFNNLRNTLNIKKSIRHYGLRRVSNWRLYTDKTVHMRPHYWRFSSIKSMATDTVWSLPKMTSIITSLVNENPIINKNMSKLLSTFESKQLIEKFIKQSAMWLSARYSERQLYNKLINLSSSNVNTTKIILLNREELFRAHPFWWHEESKRRLNALSLSLISFLNDTTNSQPTVDNILTRSNHYHFSATSLEIAEDSTLEKNLLSHTLSLLPLGVHGKLKSLSLQDPCNAGMTKLQTTYDFWLDAAAVNMKKLKMPQYSRTHKFVESNVSFNLGNEQHRFPGTGRRHHSYDSALRVFYKKTSIARLRRVHSLRFIRLKPILNAKFYTKVPKVMSLRQRRLVLSKASLTNRYFSKAQRRLQNLYAATKITNSLTKTTNTLPEVPTKRRLASSSIQVLFDRKTLTKPIASLPITLERLMLAGIKLRKRARQLQNLTLHATRRIPSKEQILPPKFIAIKKNKRLKLRNLRKDRRVHRGLQNKSNNAHWSVQNFLLNIKSGNLKEDLNKKTTDEITTSSVTFQRKRGALRGYVTTRIRKKFYKRSIRRSFRRRTFKKGKAKNPFKGGPRRYWCVPKKVKSLVRRLSNRKFYSSRKLKRIAVRRLLKREWLCNNSFGYRLLNGYNFKVATPLQFIKKTNAVVISEEEKHYQSEGMEVLKHGYYKRAGHFANALTQLFPHLISFIIDEQLTSRMISSKELRGMVHATYWSLRFYLQNNFATIRKTTREAYFSQITALRNQLVRDSESQYFDMQIFKKVRQRYQPYSLNGRSSLRRGALDWLRMFFPRFHALYLEDPEEYKKFFLSATQAMRAHPARTNPGKWATNKISSPMESKYKRLLRSEGMYRSKHFENVLNTTKRLPILTGYGHAVNMRSGSFSSSTVTPKSSFFRRSYSTSKSLYTKYEFTTLNHVSKVSKFIPTQAASLADYKALALRQQLAKHAYNKTKTHKLGNPSEIDSAVLDPRFIRLKSPRSGRFIQRVPLYKNDLIKNITSELQKNDNITHSSRSNTSGYAETEEGEKEIDSVRLLSKLRRDFNVLHHRSKAVYTTSFKPRRLYSDESRAKRCFNRLRLQWYSKVQKVKKSRINPEGYKIIETKRSVLHHRHAEQRSLKNYFVRAPIVPHGSVIIRPKARLFLTYKKVLNRFVARTYKTRKRYATTTFRQRYADLFYKKAVEKLPRRRLRFHRKTVFFAHRLQLKNSSNLRFQYATKNTRKLKVSKQSYKHSKIFVSQNRRFYKNKHIVSNFLVNKEFSELNDPNTERRREVWDLLTLRWLKKRRVLKNWLKNVKRGLKRNKWKFTTEEAFKGTRVRLRKLNWREPDGHFSRNLRYAFQFYPTERRKAPWLEKLMYRRSLYSTIRSEYRRYQIPREQKRLKWLQNYRRSVVAPRRSAKYLRARRWPRLRIYNQRLFRSLFSLKNKRVAQRHFKKLSRHKPRTSGFSKSLSGLGDRLDVNLILLNIAPTVFWARVLATFGLFKINNKVIYDPAYRFKPKDRIFWNWELIERLRIYFQRPLRTYESAPLKTAITFPKNFKHFPNIKTSIYMGLPRPEDLLKNSRLSPFLFKLFKADAGFGRQ